MTARVRALEEALRDVIAAHDHWAEQCSRIDSELGEGDAFCTRHDGYPWKCGNALTETVNRHRAVLATEKEEQSDHPQD
jgi:hypothetical protein